MKKLFVMALVVGLSAGLVAQTGTPPAVADALVVTGAVTTPLTLSLADLGKMPRTTVTINEGGTDVKYEGVLLTEILKRAGAPTGAALRGKALASYLLCEAKDGYRVVFALPEFDPEFSDNPIIVADKRDGQLLVDNQGPFRIMAPRDKKAARGVRMLVKLTVVQIPD